MFIDNNATGDRIRAAAPVAAIHVALAFVLLRGLQPGAAAERDEALKLISLPPPKEPQPELTPPPPPPPAAGRAQPLRQADPRPEGAAAPPNLESRPTPVVAPEPLTRPPIQPPPTVPSAPVAGAGFAPSAGAAPVRGPGTGGGGIGTGTGSGRSGGGAGGGGGGGGNGAGSGRVATMPRLLRGEFSWRDIPGQLQDSGFRGRVGLRFVIDIDGRPRGCRVSRSSGSRLMDQAACRALEQRFRFAPARDETGRPVAIPGEDNPFFEADAPMPDEPPRRRRGW